MSQKDLAPAPQPLRRGGSWIRTLLVGLLLFVVTLIVMVLTSNANLYPTVILIGNFLVPVVFVAFLYDHRHFSALSPMRVACSFLIGGILGVIGASLLESLLLPVPTNPSQGLPLTSALLVGLIEEGCKGIAVILLARGMKHDSEMDGLLLGGAVGMGFAALESTGYAFTSFVTSGGHVTVSIAETVLRGILSPFGHGLWTAILGAVLFRQSKPHRFRITIPVLLTYLFVSILHGFWDGLPHTILLVIPPGIPLSITILLISILGILVLSVIYRRAIAQQRQTATGAHVEWQAGR